MYRITVLILCLFLQGCAEEKDSDESQETVYINNGAIQCESEGLSELETAQQLIDNGIDVILSTCGVLTGISTVTVCGAEDIRINLHVINAQNLADAQELGFESVSSLKNEDGIGYMILGCEE
ncbi:MAG: hypothetical protein PVI97_08245 [Candidatus Thiodiazotropha sp.]|jgi:hypothetical protein